MHGTCRLIMMLGVGVALTVQAWAAELEKPIPISVVFRDGGRVSGKIVAFDESGFDLARGKDKMLRVPWPRILPQKVYDIHYRLLARDDGQAWIQLGAMLRGMEGGIRFSDQALRHAIRIDSSLKEQADKIREGDREVAGEPAAADQDGGFGGSEPGHAHAGNDAGDGPQVVGHAQADFWGELPEALMASSVQELKNFASDTQEKMSVRLVLYETNNFLFYSDMPRGDSVFWAKKLEAMYNKLCWMFDIDKSRNIFRGKCLIFVFRNEPDYHRFQKLMHGTESAGTAGMCHSYGNGYVHIAFYRQPDQWRFAHVLVHESSHGFLHRYRSPINVPSWINEGLAETISHSLVPQSPTHTLREKESTAALKRRRSTGGMFDFEHIQGWQYGVARLLSEFMIEQNRERYAAFVNAIKDGMTWQESLGKEYGVELDKLVLAFGKSIGVKDLKP